MGRHHEVRAKAMATTGKIKSALYMRASKEIYMAAKSGVPDPNSNLALRSAIEKYKGQMVPRDVIERAIKKAQGGDQEVYIPGRYEVLGPSGSYIVVDTLSANANRALVEVRTLITRKGGHLGSVLFNFTETGVLAFKGENRDEIEEALILGDVDVWEVSLDDGVIEVDVAPSSFAKAKEVLNGLGIKDFDTAEITLIANEYIDIDDESKEKLNNMLDGLDDLEDVQAVYHNVNL